MTAVAQHCKQACQSKVGPRQFKPAETAISVSKADLDCSGKAAIRRVRAPIATEESEAMMRDVTNLPQQGEMVRSFVEICC